MKYRLLIFAFLLMIVSFTASCSKGEEVISTDETLFINGRLIDEPGMVIKIEGSSFIRLDFINRYREINSNLKHESHLSHFVNLSELELDSRVKSLFYSPKAVIFTLPLVKRGGYDYLDVNYLVDFYGFTSLEFSSKLILFSPDYENIPNRVGLLKQGSRIYLEREGKDDTLVRDEEVYFVEKDDREDIIFYSSSFDTALCKPGDLGYISNYLPKRRILEAKSLRSRYSRHLMAFDDRDSYEEFIEGPPRLKMEGLSVLLPRALSLNKGKLVSKQDAAYMDAALDLGCDIIPVLDIRVDEELLKLLKDDFSMKSSIDSLLLYALYYGYSGLDINLIHLRDEDAALISSYLSKLSNKFKSAGLSFALNLYPSEPGTYKLGLNPPLNTAVDYYMAFLMDEDLSDWKPYPSQRPAWVEEELHKLLKKLPSEKLVLVQGLYVRAYELTNSGSKPISKQVFPASEIYSKTDGLIMETGRDEDMDQLYYKFKNPDNRNHFIVWMDDEKSYAKKFKLIQSENLQGLALWSYSMLDDYMIEMIQKALSDK